jgi:hypothetical protein
MGAVLLHQHGGHFRPGADTINRLVDNIFRACGDDRPSRISIR